MKKSFLVIEVENGYIIQPHTPYMNKDGNEKTWIAKDMFDVRDALTMGFEVPSKMTDLSPEMEKIFQGSIKDILAF